MKKFFIRVFNSKLYENMTVAGMMLLMVLLGSSDLSAQTKLTEARNAALQEMQQTDLADRMFQQRGNAVLDVQLDQFIARVSNSVTSMPNSTKKTYYTALVTYYEAIRNDVRDNGMSLEEARNNNVNLKPLRAGE